MSEGWEGGFGGGVCGNVGREGGFASLCDFVRGLFTSTPLKSGFLD